MTTPVYDFAKAYAASGTARLHMPGHKGKPFLGCEALDITEVAGAGALYEASGIIAESEQNAAALFGSGRTLYSTEGSSQCIRAMVYLAALCRPEQDTPPVIVAARNAHKSFLYAAALCGVEIVWLWAERRGTICESGITPAALEETLEQISIRPAGVYITSPDYLGNMADMAGLAAVCRRHGVPLLVDNAHGAYLKFLPASRHPLDLGAAMCCDSAHKTLPVLTGGAYLHIAADAPAAFAERAKEAMELFGSTSPSWLTLASLDRCNRELAGDYPARLAETVRRLDDLRLALRARAWEVADSDPLRLTLRGDGLAIAARLRAGGVEPEYAGREFCVLMATPENEPGDFTRIAAALGQNDLPAPPPALVKLPPLRCERVCSPREALFAPRETIPASESCGRVCAAPTASCPPAIPVVVPGERIVPEALAWFSHYGIGTVEVLK